MLKVAVFGNRNITDEEKVRGEVFKIVYGIDSSSNFPGLIYLYGGAAGPQEIMRKFYENKNPEDVVTILFKPWHMIWSKLEFNPIFFYLRNKQIVENADKIIVFTNGEKDSEVYRVIDLCERRNKDFVIIEV